MPITPADPGLEKSAGPIKPASHRTTALVVWGVWGAMFVSGLVFVHIYGSNVPSWDDWDMVPTMTGHQPVTLHWLWSQHNEHRIPVPRLIMLALLRSTADFRACMYFNVAAMALLAAGLIAVAGRLRGRASYCDAFFPLLLLNPGQGLNFMWGWQVEFITSTLWAGAALLLVVANPVMRPRSLAAMLVVILLLAGTGAHGLALVPGLALWGVGAWVMSRRGRAGPTPSRGAVALAVLICAISLLLVVAYLIGYQKVPHHPQSHGLKAAVRTIAKAVTMAFGPAVRSVWPWSGLAVCGLLVATGMRLLIVLRQRPLERVRAWGLLCFLGAVGCLALALGLGRDGFEPRYVTLMCALLCGVYFVWSLYGPPRAGRVICALMMAGAAVALWPNARFGIDYASDLREHLRDFERDMASGSPPFILISRYNTFLHPSETLLTDYLPMLRDGKIGQFTQLHEDPPTREVRVPLQAIRVSGGTWDGHQVKHDGLASIDVPLARPTRIAGVRLRYKWSNDAHRQPLIILSWRDENAPFDLKHRYRSFPTGDRANWEHGSYSRIDAADWVLLVWIDERTSELRIAPDYMPGTFSIEELILLVPASEDLPEPIIAR